MYQGNHRTQNHSAKEAPRSKGEPLTTLNFADKAEETIKNLEKNRNGSLSLTTSKIRNLLSMTNTLYTKAMQLRTDTLEESLLNDIQYLKVRFAYEAGRERNVKDFVEKAEIMKHIEGIGDRKQGLLLFCRYMESLVAYHRFYGGRDR